MNILGNSNVTIIATGGTIAKTYTSDNLVNSSLMIDEMVSCLQLPGCNINIVDLFRIDSLVMTISHRQKIAKIIAKHQKQNEAIIITHGTDTMAETGKYLYQYFCGKKNILTKPVILTGAMLPFCISKSDALQNLTEALIAAKFLEPSIYIVIHNQILPLPNVKKDYKLKTFRSTKN